AWLEGGDSEKEEVGCALRSGRRKAACLFPTAPAHRPSFFSYLSPQEFVDLSNQMYIESFFPYSVNHSIVV
ncbi:hypothetical protein P4420_30700, partial [Bacillus thuringiensis]|nr:hypothetical protein [Bacillus thuringiensis]